MAPTETLPVQVFGTLPTVSAASAVAASQINAHIHKDNRRTVITITTIIGVAIVLFLLVFWIVRQRLVLFNMLATMRGGKSAKKDVEASTTESRELSPESTRRWCVPSFCIASRGGAK